MLKIQTSIPAPVFTAKDINGQTITLSDFQGYKTIFLIFNRGFS